MTPRIAVISDIHGNVAALEAVMADLERLAPDEVLVGGDLVGRGPEGAEVVRRIAATGWATIRGNHEEYLLDFRRGEVPGKWLHAAEWAAARWMAGELGETEAAWIEDLPFSLASRLAPGLRLVHGSPRSNRDGIGPWLSDELLAGHLAEVEESLLVCAHTHRPLHRSVAGGLVVNVGSVGLPFNRDRRAQYAVFEPRDRPLGGDAGGWRVELRQVEYDLERTFAVYERSGFLAAGGVTARLLRMELEHAVPILVPFLKWTEVAGVEPAEAELPSFLEVYRPGQPLGDFFEQLARLA
jgi:predicted phosphodiesterase